MSFLQTMAHSTAPLRRVKCVQFGIFSPEELKKMAVAKIEIMDLRDEESRPRPKSLLDPRMGTIDRNVKCHTCHESMAECPGHFGYIELAKPVFHIGFFDKLKKVLECVCWSCGRLKADFSDPVFQRLLRIPDASVRAKHVWEYCKKATVCDKPSDDADAAGESLADPDAPVDEHGSRPGCGARQPTFRKSGLRLMVKPRTSASDDSALEQEEVTVERVLQTLTKITDRDAEALGLDPHFARPEWMVIQVMPVPPMTVRPSIQMDAMRPAEDDLTYKLNDILKANDRLQRCVVEGAPAHLVREYVELLQYHVATFMNNEKSFMPQALQKSGRPIKSIRARLKGKEGRLRGNLMGKRVDFSARTVITGDPNISIDQVGVPRSIARNLTYPET
ncbi:DNA-directed RNA polymerase II core subunit rpo21, partial [Coemansia nantahalensis]